MRRVSPLAEHAALRAQQDLRAGFVDGIRGFNRPTNVRFGPDGCAYVADYGAVRDLGGPTPSRVSRTRADAALVQIPGTGVIWKICPQ